MKTTNNGDPCVSDHPKSNTSQKFFDSRRFKVVSLLILLVVAAELLTIDIPGRLSSTGRLINRSDDGGVLEDVHLNPAVSKTSSFLVEDSNRWTCGGSGDLDNNKSYSQWVAATSDNDEDVLCAAHRVSMRPLPPGIPRVAFMFMTRGEIALEPVWRSFFSGHEDRYSIYVHASDRERYEFPNGSLFHGRAIPSKAVDRMGISFPEAVRRLVAYALLDTLVPNAWFTLVCEATIPLRPFSYVYDYFMHSELSFVEGFATRDWWRKAWTNKTYALNMDKMRKGEPWISVHRRHAGLIVGDFVIFYRFKHYWHESGISSEIYMPTMFAVADPDGISNHTVMYVDWLRQDKTHPFAFTKPSDLAPPILRKIQSQTTNTDGFYVKCVIKGLENEPSCVYNGQPNSTCFLFARKVTVDPQEVNKLLHSAHALAPLDETSPRTAHGS